jgi:hypothetical protein
LKTSKLCANISFLNIINGWNVGWNVSLGPEVPLTVNYTDTSSRSRLSGGQIRERVNRPTFSFHRYFLMHYEHYASLKVYFARVKKTDRFTLSGGSGGQIRERVNHPTFAFLSIFPLVQRAACVLRSVFRSCKENRQIHSVPCSEYGRFACPSAAGSERMPHGPALVAGVLNPAPSLPCDRFSPWQS